MLTGNWSALHWVIRCVSIQALCRPLSAVHPIATIRPLGSFGLHIDDDRVLYVDQVIEPIAELHALVGLHQVQSKIVRAARSRAATIQIMIRFHFRSGSKLGDCSMAVMWDGLPRSCDARDRFLPDPQPIQRGHIFAVPPFESYFCKGDATRSFRWCLVSNDRLGSLATKPFSASADQCPLLPQ
jgi:hypothetical protein